MNWDVLLDALQTKAKIFADGLHLLDTLTESDSYNLSLLHYQACDTLITKVRQEITTKSDKLALGEQANEIYTGAINVCLKLYKQTNK